MPKRPVIPVDDLAADAGKFYDMLRDSSDLAVVLVTASYLDAALASMLHRHFVKSSVSDKLLDVRGPLGTIAARSDAAYALSLIDKSLYQALTKIIEIRNEFAHHHLEHSFEGPEIARLCSELVYLDSPDVPETARQLVKRHPPSNRNRFAFHAAAISARLLRGRPRV